MSVLIHERSATYTCSMCGNEAYEDQLTAIPDEWRQVEGYEVCGKCCKIMRAFANKEV